MDVDSFTSPAQAPPLGSPASQSPTSQLLGVLVPGGPVRTDFVTADVTGSKLTLVLQAPGDLPMPLSSIPEVVCFLLPNAPLPPDFGVLVYWQIACNGAPGVPGAPPSRPDTPGFELLGALTHARPSGVFRTGWALDERLLEMERNSAATGAPLHVTLGVSIEPLANVENLQHDVTPENRLFVAQKVANDLFQYMRSFDTSNSSMMTVPVNIFDRWMQRFERRFRRDPNFFMKQEEG